MSSLDQVALLIRIALRSLRAHWVKSLIVGSILFIGTLLMVVGQAFLGSIEAAMEGSITSSLSGQFQIYDAKAEDKLELFGGFGGGLPELGEVPDFGRAEAVIGALEPVKAVVPMGLANSTVFAPTELDSVLETMREAVGRQDLAAATAVIPQVRRISETFGAEQDLRLKLTNDVAAVERDKAALATVNSEAFWAPFSAPAADPSGQVAEPDWGAMLAALDFLDTRVAPLAADGRLLYLRTIGTDLEQFSASFDRFYVVDGEMVPPGKRGFLLSKRTYERIIKNRVARELDDIRTKVVEKGETIAGSKLIQDQIARVSRQFPRVVFQLSPDDAAALHAELKDLLKDDQASLDDLVRRFLLVDDSNLVERYDWFYAHIAPRIRLYDIPLGQTITLRSFTKSGYLKTVNVVVYGTYEFKGLEKSDLASASNLTDLITFRELYGKMSDAQREELASIRETAGVTDLSREDAEAALFGGGGDIEVQATTTAPQAEPPPEVDLPSVSEQQREDRDRVWTREEMRDGLVLNAAIVLRDPAGADAARPQIQQAIDANALGVQLIDWITASGTVGQFIFVLRGVLVISFVIIFIVALIIVNNAMIMATMDRVAEIGTMRAIGARRGMVVSMFLIETVVLGLVAGALGAAAGVAFIAWLGQVGVPAVSDQLVLLFAGPRLYPAVHASQLAFGLGVVVVVAILSTLYPALLASRVQPIVAMQGKE